MPIRRQCRVSRHRRTGLSLIEVALSAALTGLIAVGAMSAVGGVFRTRVAADRSCAATAVAQSLLTEILQCRYADDQSPEVFGPDSGEDATPDLRSPFDDVDDYHGWSASPPRPKDSTTPLSGYTGWTRAVQVAYADPSNPPANAASDQGLKRIAVTVTDPTGRQTVLVAFRSKWGALQQQPEADLAVRSWIGSRLQTGAAPPLSSGVNLTNHAQDR